MNTPRQLPRSPARPGRRGFALLVTIVLVAFLVLILVGLASFTRVETQVASNAQAQAQARQNALMALNIAIGQLQKHTGPDQRVTATADLQPLATVAAPASYPTTDPASGEALNADAEDVNDNISDYWSDRRNRHWTGVWRNTNTSAFDPENPDEFNSVANATAVWLVSGNEQTSDTYKPATVVTQLGVDSTALDEINDAEGRPHRLLVKNTAGVTDAASLGRAVTAPQIPITSAGIPGSDGNAATVGHYAWWIGDEGVKARANLADPYAPASTPAAHRTRARTAQRLAIEAMTTNGTDGLAALDPSSQDNLSNFQESLQKIYQPTQLSFIEVDTTFSTAIKERYHDISVHSRGVLADVKNGGLKADLTYLLGQGNLADFRTAFNAAFPSMALDPGSAYHPVLSTASTARAAQPAYFATQPSDPNPAHVDLFTYTATWEQLWSFHNMGNATPAGVFNTSTGEAVARRHIGTQHGIAPLIIQAKLFYRMRIVGGTAAPASDGVTMVNHSGIIHIDIIPIIVLANPYNVTLAEADYRLAATGLDDSRVRVRAGSPDLGAEEFDPNDFTVSVSTGLSNSSLGAVRLRIKSPPIPPGRALVFSLKDPLTEIPKNTNDQRAAEIEMINEFLPTHALTYNTEKPIPPDNTHIALLPNKGSFSLKLYTDEFTEALGDWTMIRHFQPRTYQEEAIGDVFIVEPMSDGTRQGGGFDAYVHDAAFGAGLYGDHSTRKDQVGVFFQNNYRALTVADAAATSFESSGRDIARSWARTRVKGGASAGSASWNPYLASHLIFTDPDMKQVRWGLYNNGAGVEGDQPAPQLAGDAGIVNILYDVPRAEHPLSSLAQLQHFNLAGHVTDASYGSGGTRNSYTRRALSFQNNYPIGNSYPNVLLNRERLMDYDAGMSFQHDGSYLWNDALFDRFYFSTYPQSDPFDFSTAHLPNSRHRPWRDTDSVPWNNPSEFRGDGNPATAANSRIAAQNLLVEGAFNVNSTSVEAWKAVFSSLRNIPVGSESDAADLTAPFARTLYQPGAVNGPGGDSKAGNTANAWTGTVNLSASQIHDLAQEMVLQVRRRGPFLSLADFTNRRLIAKAADTLGIGLSGALQSAIDRVINQPDDVDVAVRTKTRSRSEGNRRIPDDDARMPTGISGYPGYLLQGDVLSSIGASLSARSDTFTIRTYGDVVSPVDSTQILGRAWCEAVVQRTPDYVIPAGNPGGNAPHETPTASSPNAEFGRRYQIVSFRWLSPEDL